MAAAGMCGTAHCYCTCLRAALGGHMLAGAQLEEQLQRGASCSASSPLTTARRCASTGPTGSGGHRVPSTNPNGNSLPPETVTWIVVGSVAGAVIIGAVAYNLWDRTRRGGVAVLD